MTCEEFALVALDLGSATESPLLQAAREHLHICRHCAALQEQWLSLRSELRLLGQENSRAQAPARVEMRLRQEFRTKHKTMKTQRAAVVATWALAAAAVLLVAVSWVRWHQERINAAAQHPAVISAPQRSGAQTPSIPGAAADLGQVVVASNDSSSDSDFTLLPGSMLSPTEDATVVRVGMQRAALSAFGLTVNEEHAGDWIQVDMLVGDDGVPQAVRLPESSQ
jgi:hypothetical protein